ncbi:DegT/DnrJ/EryC1/StrS family aminotransferase [uncultured Campylobacter sp.]|uniref:DegT/DnrJ/EryC1/StrS family aminotransferase n=1 Tax=uncultured Campylobacter sp. TaxID=218934 RepID=UPI0028E99D40|nr:DegT/DnrJ/EryC1/StrS family aminotransferase [uncultured Campylobacter sp.]
MKINFIDLQGQYRKYKNEIDEQIAQTLDSSAYIGGQKVALLEENLARFSGAKHAIACSNGSSAIFVSLLALGIGHGDEVITSPFTFFATAEMIALTGAKPVFVDIDEKTYNIDPNLIQAAITPKTKAIMPVSLFGQIADMKRINQIAAKHGLTVIEDAAQSFGAKQEGARSCSLSRLATTSFFPAKPLGCYGDGGAIFTSDDELAQKIKILLNHGSKERYFHSAIGINGRLDAIQAGVLNVKLKYFEGEITRRQEIAARYGQNLKNVVTPFVERGNTSVWAQYCIRVKDRARMLEICAQKGVPTGVYYPLPLHLQEVFKDLGYKKGDFAVSERVSEDIMALPMSAFLSEQEQDYVIEVINNA